MWLRGDKEATPQQDISQIKDKKEDKNHSEDKKSKNSFVMKIEDRVPKMKNIIEKKNSVDQYRRLL